MSKEKKPRMRLEVAREEKQNKNRCSTTTMKKRMITKHQFLKTYTLPGSPFAFSSPNPVFKHFNGSIPINKIQKWLLTSDTYTLHRQPKAPKPRNQTYAYCERYQFQIDLIEIGKMVNANNNYCYLLTAIDIFFKVCLC